MSISLREAVELVKGCKTVEELMDLDETVRRAVPKLTREVYSKFKQQKYAAEGGALLRIEQCKTIQELMDLPQSYRVNHSAEFNNKLREHRIRENVSDVPTPKPTPRLRGPRL